MAVHRSPASSPRRKWTAASQAAKAASPGAPPKKVQSAKTGQDLPSPYSKTTKHSRKGSLSPSVSASLIAYPSAFRKRHKFRVQAFVLCLAFAAVSSGILFFVAMRVPNIDDSAQQQTLVLPDAFQQRNRRTMGVNIEEKSASHDSEKLSSVDISAYGDTIAGRRQGGYVISGRGASLLETQRAEREKQEREEMERQRLELRKQQLEKLLENIPADTEDKGKSAKGRAETATATKGKGGSVATDASAAKKVQGKKRVASRGGKDEKAADNKVLKRRSEDSKGGKDLPQRNKKEADEKAAKREGRPKDKAKGSGQKESGSKPGDKGGSRRVDAGKGKKAAETGKSQGKGPNKNPGKGSKENQAKQV